jgi:glycosyltransferase involved in cell wall biosynthesis
MKLSVIMPTYNYGHLLPETLRSLAAQTFQDFELLVVDDGSTDHTEEVVRGFSSQLRNCVYLKKPHTGPADSRRFAVQAATGTHIASLDSDDMWSPEYLEVVRRSFENHPQAEVFFCDGLHVQSTGKVMYPTLPADLPPSSGEVTSLRELFQLCINFCPTGMVFSKSLYQRVGPFDPRYGFGLCDDTDWVVRAVIAGARCIRIDRKLFLHRVHGSNLTTDPVAYLEPWLGVYAEKIKGSRLGPEFERYARHFTRGYVLRLLGVCSPAKGRRLLSQTLEVLPGDAILTSAYLSTYLGSTSALKLLKLGKRLIRKILQDNRRLDLSAPPVAIFEGVK